MSYVVRLVDDDVWRLEAPDETVLSDNNDLPVTTPEDIVSDIEAHAGLLPVYQNNYEIIDDR
jgi:hypothetical protein